MRNRYYNANEIEVFCPDRNVNLIAKDFHYLNENYQIHSNVCDQFSFFPIFFIHNKYKAIRNVSKENFFIFVLNKSNSQKMYHRRHQLPSQQRSHHFQLSWGWQRLTWNFLLLCWESVVVCRADSFQYPRPRGQSWVEDSVQWVPLQRFRLHWIRLQWFQRHRLVLCQQHEWYSLMKLQEERSKNKVSSCYVMANTTMID